MSATHAQIRAGLQTALSAIPDCQTSAYALDNPSPPTLQVMGFDEGTYDLAMARGLDEWIYVVQGFAGTPLDRGAQTLLDTWANADGSSSVKAAVEADKTLGGIIDDLHVYRSGGHRIFNMPSRVEVLGTDWLIRIYASA